MKLLALPYSSPEPFAHLFDDVIEVRSQMPTPKLDKEWIILFGGGTDVDPVYYGEKPVFHTQTPHKQRDQFEVGMYMKYVGAVGGFIGICRGAQLLTITNNGKLVQHIEGNVHLGTHPIDVVDPDTGAISRIPASSVHHQMMWPFVLPKEKYQILGWTSKGHTARRLLMTDKPVNTYYKLPEKEPDIVWYPETKSLAIQGHPEFISHMHPYSKISRRWVAKLFGTRPEMDGVG